MDVDLQSKMQESNQQVNTLHENIAALKELHKVELEELKREVEKQVFITQACNQMYAKGYMGGSASPVHSLPACNAS